MDPSPSSVSATVSSSSLSRDMDRQLSLREPEEVGTSGTTPPPQPPSAAMAVTPPASSKALRHPPRPGFGKFGRRCVVKANHFLVEVAGKDLCHYDVSMNPEPISKTTNRTVINELVRLHRDSELGRRMAVYDGRKSWYTAGALPFTSKNFVVKFPDIGRDGNVRYTAVSRSFFSPRFGYPMEIGDGIEVWRGYYQSLRLTQMGPSLNVDTSATSFYKSVPVVDFVVEYLNLRDSSRPLSDANRIKKMINGGTIEYWTCLNFSRVPPNDVFRFCNDLVGMCNDKGMVFNPEPFSAIRSAPLNDMESALKVVYNQSMERLSRLGKHIQLLIVILPEMRGHYGKVKRVCDTELGIVSQCCLPKHVSSRGNKQYLENVALKINVKVGGRNTVLDDAIHQNIPCVTDMPTIIFGADVTHPAPGEDSSPSIAAVVASMDWPEVTKYKGLVSAQEHRREMIQDLYTLKHDPQKGYSHGGMIRELLLSFYRAVNRKPDRIIFYRDGVSEGQFADVLLYEMDAIRKACASLQEGYLPRVTFIVVQKRHHTRLFPQVHGDRSSTDRSGNILPGTVVDTSICHPTEFDFYLCSHAGIKGTSRPTHYHVLLDENRFTADTLQMLTNNLCYTYARCTRSVSVVPPAYYAHLAAFRARYYVESDLSEGGSTSVGGSKTRDKSAAVRHLPQIKDNVKEVMFFC
ncbi:hypothetical protein COCNU_06G013450 [Cocos nucifera]|uniref:Piwi domain-containing protein n=1 Tax=Cocos nucifera TaxID=13894 RepID=A0A8K0IC46_COCNU|nr:hypothetical protein COCNU_06G013450 [Cocos nucifera]